MAQTFGKRQAEGHGHADIETAADQGQAQLLTFGGGDAHAGVATDALAGLVDDFRMREIRSKRRRAPAKR